ncbi:hypothetical protein TRAPUB_8070 [Trametes pubescens]|uniref:Uncharacterized protein n=1 Tax=Trametes pubescens TaxID=154538 RepID=A0A1M2W6K2_TRAPU|nr:hypothetical protein TRAPUB_8070 [Trametes pubescens]
MSERKYSKLALLHIHKPSISRNRRVETARGNMEEAEGHVNAHWEPWLRELPPLPTERTHDATLFGRSFAVQHRMPAE